VVEKWLEREIARGLQGLIALRLSGAPADDSVTLTLDVWLAAIESLSANWNEQLDAERVRRAFRTLYRICDRWPRRRHCRLLRSARSSGRRTWPCFGK